MKGLKPCPFCGWDRVKVIEKVAKRGGLDEKTWDRKSKVRVQVICNRCHSRGKPFTTDWLLNYGDWMRVPYLKQREMIQPWIDKAVDAWNERKR